MEIIKTVDLTKRYDKIVAADSLNITAEREIYGLLGPNGSGKTTTVAMLTSMLTPTSGTATICGHDVRTEQGSVRECMSYVPQNMAVDIKLTGRENVNFYAKLYGIDDKNERKRRTEDVLETMNLTERADDRTEKYSGGMQRRLELAQALVHQPEVLFLDEPTVGLDVSSRHSIWQYISKLRDTGITVFVTTHHMDEAEKYCDKVGILKEGVMVKEGTPSELVSMKRSVIRIETDKGVPSHLPDGVEIVSIGDEEVLLSVEKGSDLLPDIVRAYDVSGIKIRSFAMREPTLEDIYLTSVGPIKDTAPFDKTQFRNMMRRVG